MPIFLGNQQIGLASLGSSYVDNIQHIPFPTPPVPIPTNGLQFWLDPTSYSGSGSKWLSTYGNATGSFTGSYIYSGSTFFNMNTGSVCEFNTTSSLDYSTTQNTFFVVGRSSGSITDYHGRLISAKNNNWLVGTYGGGGGAGGDEYQRAYDPGGAGGFFDTPFDTQWRVYTGIWQNTASASFYVNGVFVTTLTNTGRVGPNGFSINNGAAQLGTAGGGENTQADYGDMIFYNRVLSDSEITQVYNAIKSKYGL
jgi:hypothetical protein